MRFLSVFSGIEAASVAWSPLGWRAAAFAEIEPFPCAVLAHHWPDVPNLGDVTQITDARVAALGRIDLVAGGSPCQDLSVAGKRAGLDGARSGLFHELIRIFHAARHFCGARYLLWENVPGAFSSNGGRDFGVVVGAMAGCRLDVPKDGWGSEGVALGEHGLVEWGVLDAQWFGVAQRRRRVFALLDTGNWAGRPPILLERDSLSGHSAPSRQTRQDTAGTLSARTQGGGGLGTDFDLGGGLIASNAEGATGLPFLTASNIGKHVNNQTPLIAHTLRGDGFDASEDGTGRGTPLVPVAFDTTQITSAANRSNPKPGDPSHPLTAGGHPPAIAFPANMSGTQRASAENLSPSLCATNPTAIAFAFPRPASPAMAGEFGVRRLTPVEAERLMGFPDNYTRIPWRGKPAEDCPDGPRYRALGNSWAVDVVRWIGRRIEAAKAVAEQAEKVAA